MTSSASPPSPPSPPSPLPSDRSPVVALLLGWLLPGAGHAYAGRWGKAVLFFSSITALLVAGLIIGGGTNIQPTRLWYAAQLCAGGPTIALTSVSEYLATCGFGATPNRLSETGTLHTAVAGFLNLLVMMDAYLTLAYPERRKVEEGAA